MTTLVKGPTGKLAFEALGVRLPLQVLRSAAGHYLGTYDDEGPVSRESVEYWSTAAEAQAALDAGPDAGLWTQRDHC